MEFPKSEILGLIYHLLPGFIAAWIFYSLTAHPVKSPFERLVQALIFTGFVKVASIPIREILYCAGCRGHNFGPLTSDGDFFLQASVGVAIGILFTICANTSCIHDRLPDWVTKRSSFSSEWYGVFYKERRFVYLHLRDLRRIYGWPSQWPDSPISGHFVLQEANWVLPDNSFAPLLMTKSILIPAKDVVMVELEKNDAELASVDFDRHSEIVKKLVELQSAAAPPENAELLEEPKARNKKKTGKKRKEHGAE